MPPHAVRYRRAAINQTAIASSTSVPMYNTRNSGGSPAPVSRDSPPTTSSTMALALGDALAMTVMRQKGVTRTDFGRLHPGGSLGARLKPVRRLMHGGKFLPLTREDSSMHDTVVEMSAKRLGVVGVTDALGYLVGVITDGDLRRNIERGLEHTAGEFMTRDPKTLRPDDLIDDALVLFDEYKITTLFVVKEDGRGKKPVGVLHIHDCPAAR